MRSARFLGSLELWRWCLACWFRRLTYLLTYLLTIRPRWIFCASRTARALILKVGHTPEAPVHSTYFDRPLCLSTILCVSSRLGNTGSGFRNDALSHSSPLADPKAKTRFCVEHVIQKRTRCSTS